MKKTLVNTLRWIGTIILPLPIFCLTYFIASIIVSAQNYFLPSGAPGFSIPGDCIIPGVAGYLAGTAAVALPRVMAPCGGRIVGWTFAALITTLEVINLTCLALDYKDFSVFEIGTIIVSNMTSTIGAICATNYKLD